MEAVMNKMGLGILVNTILRPRSEIILSLATLKSRLICTYNIKSRYETFNIQRSAFGYNLQFII